MIPRAAGQLKIWEIYPRQTGLCPGSFLKETKAGFCFDINHAIETAIYLNEDYIEFIKKFVELKPAHYHLGGQNIKQKKGHISFKESDIDLKKILELIPKNAEITLEVSTDIEKTKEDLKIIRNLIKNSE